MRGLGRSLCVFLARCRRRNFSILSLFKGFQGLKICGIDAELNSASVGEVSSKMVTPEGFKKLACRSRGSGRGSGRQPI